MAKVLEQHIAVFGEGGSGKTVLISSFYGATQEPQFLQDHVFHVLADKIGDGARLHQNYLGMRDAARLPMTNHFSATSYAFSVRLQEGANPAAQKAKPFDALRLVWHDYPGEWFTEDPSGPEEAQRRVETFRSLLGSDVAVVLVDGQKLLDNAGAEERYLKSLFSNLHNGLLSLKDDLLVDGKPLVEFPRIWIMALSKSDLLPDTDVWAFRDLLISKVSEEIGQLRKLLAGFVEASDALAVGEDFLLLSSARFDAGRIEVSRRVGLDLVLPLAAMLPFERHVRWSKTMQLPGSVAANVLDKTGAVAAALLSRALRRFGPVGLVMGLFGPNVVDDAVKLAGEQLKALNAEARAKHDHLTATLTRFRMDLDEGEQERVLLRSRR